MVHSGSKIRFGVVNRSYFYLLASDARAVLRPTALCLMKVRCAVGRSSSLGDHSTFVLQVIGVMLMALFLNEAFWQGLCLVLHILLELIGRFTKS